MASQELINIIIKAVDEASATAQKVHNNLLRIGDVSSKLSKIPGFDAMKSKLSSVASTIDGKMGGALTRAREKFNTLKTSVTNTASTIRTKMGSALDGVRNKLSSLSGGTSSLASAMGFLKGAVSMTAGMIGFELVSGIVEAGRAAINASSQLDYFGQRLQNASGKTKMSEEQFKEFKGQLGELQKEFRKVDMTAVGATVEEMTMKFKLPVDKMADLTKMTAVVSSAFVKEGSTQENAILAVSDAMDGQFKRLQEIGITQDVLKKNGWNGNLEDQAGLIDALNKSLEDLGFTDTAKDITNLDEAFTALSIAGGQLMQAVLVPLTPILIQIINAAIQATDAVKPFISTLQGAWNALPDWLKDTAWAAGLVLAIYLIGTAVMSSLVPALAAATLAAIDFFMVMLANPLTWVVIALVAIALAIYEVGKAFGWWTDVSSMLDAIWAGLMNIYNTIMSNTTVQAVIQELTNAFNWLVGGVNAAISIFNQFLSGQLSLPEAIMGVLNLLLNGYNIIYTRIMQLAAQFATNMLNKAMEAGRSTLNGIMTYVSQLPGKVYAKLVAVVSRIVSAGSQWVSSAKQKASELVSGAVSTISSLPGKISSALAGVVDAVVKPFRDAYNQAKGWWDKITNLNLSAGGDFNAAGGTDIYETGGTDYLEITINHNLENLPDGLSAEDVAYYLNEAVLNDSFVRAIAESRSFQKYDYRMKGVLTGKNNRSLGV